MAEGDGDRSDALSGPDGTAGADVVGGDPDGVGVLPGFEQPQAGSSTEAVDAVDAEGRDEAVRPESSVDDGHRGAVPPVPRDSRTVTTAPVGEVRYRPRIEPEPSILGLSRHARGRLGARAFNLFFVAVFAVILIQLIVALLTA